MNEGLGKKAKRFCYIVMLGLMLMLGRIAFWAWAAGLGGGGRDPVSDVEREGWDGGWNGM